MRPIYTNESHAWTHGSLFSGIGGFDLAAEWMGWENLFHCEWNDFGAQVLQHYWPNAEHYGDITKTDFSIWRGKINILSGGFPCQPYSSAGKRLGKEDDRHLWPEMLRAIQEISPDYIVGENVYGLINWSGGLVFEEVQTELESIGYQVQPFVLPASGIGAPHKRDRVWFIAHTSDRQYKYRLQGRKKKKDTSLRDFIQADEWDVYSRWEKFPTQPPLLRGDDGLSAQLDGITFQEWRKESIKAYGNAIVPQVALEIFKALKRTHQEIYFT